MNRTPLTNDDGEVRELTAEDFALAKPLKDVMPPDFVKMVFAHQAEMEAQGKMKKGRGKQKAPTKRSITLRLNQEIIDTFKATGKGWQSRINDALLKHIQAM